MRDTNKKSILRALVMLIFVNIVIFVHLGCTPEDNNSTTPPKLPAVPKESDTRWANMNLQSEPTYPALDLSVGFRGINWGANLRAINLVYFNTTAYASLASKEYSIESFRRDREWPLLGNLKLKDLIYTQIHGTFCHVEIKFSASSTTRDVKLFFDSLFYETDVETSIIDPSISWYSWGIGGYYDYYGGTKIITVILFPDFEPRVTIEYTPICQPYYRHRMERDRIEREAKDDVKRQTYMKDFYGK
ncbi:MAG: hypothetical protein H3C30_08125 [Candidatus Hydrogenedentes bacterium]|nr:hypothetical protein [Candidatus Hydrogenedentota bacterium]